jgi:hypothetical protein
MERQTQIWLAVMLLGGVMLLARAAMVGNGRQYVQEVQTQVEIDGEPATLTSYSNTTPARQGEPGVSLSLPRTIGLWVAAFCTIGIMSFLVGDTPLYKLVESIFVGVSAAYYMVVGFWSEIVQNLLAKLIPDLVRLTVMPGLDPNAEPNYWYSVPLILSVMLLMRLSPQGAWISRWPLAFFIGATAGIRLVSYLEADFVQQISNTILPLAVYTSDRSFDLSASVRNILIVAGVLMGLVYFFFSVEHKGVVGAVARGGVWLLMITFGASFGYTVMGRIALLADRLEFLFNDWLWLIDPAGTRGGI